MMTLTHLHEQISRLNEQDRIAILGIIDLKTEADMEKVLKQLERINGGLSARIDAMEAKINSRIDTLESTIKAKQDKHLTIMSIMIFVALVFDNWQPVFSKIFGG